MKEQHKNLADLLSEFDRFNSVEKIEDKQNVKEIRKKLSLLSGKLKVHMQREDDFLYPRLLEDDSKKIQNKAQEFIAEMGNLADDFQEFNKKYLSQSFIQENSEDFLSELEEIMNALVDRVERENKELYPLLEEKEKQD